MTPPPADPSPAPPGLFDPARHEPLAGGDWDAAAARDAVVRIAQAAADAFDAASDGWPTHPLDEPWVPGETAADLYLGAAGVLWALRHLAARGAIDPDLPARLMSADRLARLARRAGAAVAPVGHGRASYLCGESGVGLLQWALAPSIAGADALHTLLRANLPNPAREPLWGHSGSVLAAIHLAEATGEARWGRLVQDTAEQLLAEMQRDPETGTWVWEQDLYGRQVRYLGAGHGLAGNAYPALRGAAWIDPALATALLDRSRETLEATALRADGCLNWHPMIDAERVRGRLPLVQDCHGAPGVVCRLAGAPAGPAWDALLRGAGELTWRAGPLVKGASLCHGTAGSVFAMLKLARRFGEPVWAERARRLAMHAAAQVEQARRSHGRGRHTLWTGDLGTACALWACLNDDDRFPTLDVF